MSTENKPVRKLAEFDKAKQSELGKRSAIARRNKKDVETIQKLADGFYNKCKESDYPPTISGLARALGFDNRQALITATEVGKEHTKKAYKVALQRYDEFLEAQALTSKNSAGAIFLLKNRGFKDTQDIHTESKSISITVDSDIKNVISKLKEDKI